MNCALSCAMSRPRMPYFSLASTTIERPSGVSSESEASCAASASSCSADAGERNEFGRLPVAEGDRAGLVEQQRVDVARRLDRAARHRQHVEPHEPVHAGDADRRQQRADRRRDQGDEQRDQHQHADGCRRHRTAKLGIVATAKTKMSVMPASRMLSAISFGVFCRSAPSTSAIIRSRKVEPGAAVIRTLIQSERTRVPPVTAERSPPLSRITGARFAGDRRFVDRGDALDDVAVGRDQIAGLDQHDIARLQRGRRHLLAIRVPAAGQPLGHGVGLGLAQASRPAPCRGPRPPPRRNWRTAR